MDQEQEQRVIDVTFHSTPPSLTAGWGWRIPQNPAREPGKWTEAEREVSRLAAAGTVQQVEVWQTRTRAYWAPFSYPNVHVDLGRPGTGVEYNPDGAEIDIYPYGAITIEEVDPIVAVTVIGSGCSGEGYVVLEAEPLEWKYPRTAVRMRRSGLWGIHVRGDAFIGGHITENWNDAGLSSARFDIPESRRVIVGGGSNGGDPHYCIRTVRIEVRIAA